jgi:hypothetical protein
MDETIKKINNIDNEIIEINERFQVLIEYLLKGYEEKNLVSSNCIENDSNNIEDGTSNFIIQTDDYENNYMKKQKEETYTENSKKKQIANVLNDVSLLSIQKINVEELVKKINKTITKMHSSVEEIFSVQSSIQTRKLDVDNHINELFVLRQIDKLKDINTKKD